MKEYEGGQLELRHPDVPQNFTKAGDALLFNSGLEHRVTPVTKGTRYSLTCWAHGPNWR
jgi:PKHD-type hydroxylase